MDNLTVIFTYENYFTSPCSQQREVADFCEMSKTMYELSVDVILSNNMSDKVTILHRKSNDIDVPKDIPER